jgi:phage gpG-like protein
MARLENINMEQLRVEFKKLYKELPTIAGTKAVGFFKDSFRRQGWANNGKLNRWQARNPAAKRNSRRALLINTGRLRRSIRITAKGTDYVKIGTDVPYAQIHNEGGTIQGTQKVRAHRRRKFERPKGRRSKKVQSGDVQVKAHTRQVNTKIPQRQFLGESTDVIKSVEREIFKKMDAIIKNL